MAIRRHGTLVLLVCVALSWCFSADAALTRRATWTQRRQAQRLSGSGIKQEAVGEKEEDDEDTDNDDEDDDDEAAPASKKPVAPSGLAPKEAVEEDQRHKQVAALERALADNVGKQKQLKQRIKHLSDEPQANKQIDASATMVANETESVAMANMLGQMWKEMRMFEVPFYAEQVGERIRRLEAEERAIEAKLAAARQEWHEAKEKAKREAAKEAREDTNGEEEKKDGGAQKPKVTKVDPYHQGRVEGLSERVNDDEKALKVEGLQNDASKLEARNVPVWDMPREQRHKVYEASLVYLVGGIICAFIYKIARGRYPGSFTPHFAPVDKDLSTRDFSFSIFGCFGDLNMCAAGCCCPLCRWADTMESKGLLSYWKAFLAIFVLTLLPAYTMGISSLLVVCLGVVYRQKLRRVYGIERRTPATVALDVLAWCCCTPCAIVQEAREEGAKRGATLDP